MSTRTVGFFWFGVVWHTGGQSRRDGVQRRGEGMLALIPVRLSLQQLKAVGRGRKLVVLCGGGAHRSPQPAGESISRQEGVGDQLGRGQLQESYPCMALLTPAESQQESHTGDRFL